MNGVTGIGPLRRLLAEERRRRNAVKGTMDRLEPRDGPPVARWPVEGWGATGADSAARPVVELSPDDLDYKALFDTATVGLGRTRLSDGRVILANDRLARIFGYDRVDEFVAEFSFAEHYPNVGDRDARLALFRNHPGAPVEAPFTRRDGSLVMTEAEVRIDEENGFIDFAITDVTERYQALRDLERMRRDYRMLFDSAAVGIGRSRLSDGRVLLANRKLAEMFGYDDPRDMVADYNFEAGWRGREERGRMISAFASEPTQISEQTYRRADGTDVTVVAHDVLNRAKGWVDFVVVDITETKAAVHRHEEKRALVEALVEHLPVLLSVKDPDGRYLYASRSYTDLLGAPNEDVVGTSVTDLLCVDSATRLAAADAAVIESREPLPPDESFSIEVGERTMQVTKFPIMGRDGEVGAVGTVGIDITEQVQAQRDLERNEQRFREFAESAADWFWETDAEGRFSYVSDGYEERTGLRSADVIGKTRREVFPESSLGRERWLSHDRDLAAHRSFKDLELSYSTADGQAHVILVSGGPTWDESGAFNGYRGTGRDVTAIRQADEERALLEGQLRHAHKMEALGQLTGGIAHDFNNILASVLGYADLLRQSIVDAGGGKSLRYVEEILRGGNRARDLVQQMLAFSRGGTNETRPIDPAAVVREAIGLMRPMLPSSIELRTSLGDDSHAVLSESGQLQQIVTNLLINARDAMEGVGTIDVAIRTREDERLVCSSCHERVTGQWLEISISDSGPGISTEIIERVFDPFFTTKAVGKGSGMGLAMVHGIIHEHRGHIVVERSSSGGARFGLLLAPTERAVQPQAEALAPTNVAPRVADAARVLVVDDEEPVALLLLEILEVNGYQVTACTDSAQALELVERDPGAFDVVVSDQTMPGVTGVELAGAIARVRPELPVILCSGYSEYVDEERIRALNLGGYLQKPVRIPELLELIGTLATGSAD